MLKGICLALVGFFVFLAAHVSLFRVCAPRKRFVAMVQIMAVVALGLVIVHRTTPSTLGFLPTMYTRAGWLLDIVNGLLIFGFLFIGYCMFYFLVDRGFSGRVMIEIESVHERRLQKHEIAARYSIEMVLQRRLDEMLEIGQVVIRDGRYCNTAKGHRNAVMFAFVKRFLNLGEGG